MRRPFAAAALTGALLLAAGCSADPAPSPAAPLPAPSAAGGAPSAPAAPGGGTSTAGDAALKGNTRAICDQAAKTGGDFAATFAQDLKLLIDASTSTDPSSVEKAEEKTARDVQNYSYALTDLSKLAEDATVKKALADMGRQVTALKGDVRRIDATRLEKLGATLDKACGKA